MITSLVFDTCVLPQRGDLVQNPVFSALMQIAKMRGYEVLISEMTHIESVGQRLRTAEKALNDLRIAISSVAKVFSSQELNFYLPDANDAVEQWKEELDALGLIPIEGIDAIEALNREARRIPPARETPGESATGSRDAAIWLGVKRLHLSSEDRVTHFISTNTKDFAASNKSGLSPHLLEELGGAAVRFLYHASLAAAVNSLAAQIGSREVDDDALREVVENSDLVSRLLEVASQSTNPPPGWMHIVSDLNVVTAHEVRAYSVEGTRLAMWEISFDFLTVVAQDLKSEGTRRQYDGVARIWVYEAESGLSADFESLKSFGARGADEPKS